MRPVIKSISTVNRNIKNCFRSLFRWLAPIAFNTMNLINKVSTFLPNKSL